MIYWEDLEVGSETLFGHYDVTREEVLDFARKYDPQPFHLSDEEAAKTHFGRIAASGWHTCAMTMAVIARHVVAEGQAGLGSPGVDELRWLKPVYPGDTVTIEVKRKETAGEFHFLTGVMKNPEGKKILNVEFAVAWKKPEGQVTTA